MKRNRRLITAALAVLLIAIPAFAVFNEKDLAHTLSVLRFELRQEFDKMNTREERFNRSNESMRRQMVEIMKSCNELSLMLYSQNQDCTFDMTYALKEVTRKYENFKASKMPFDDIIATMDIEIDRYSRLIESLRRLPPRLMYVEGLPDSLAYHNDSLRVNVGIPRDISSPRMDSLRARMGRLDSLGRPRMLDSLNANGRMSAFFLDEQGQTDRDSCLSCAVALLKMYSDNKDRIVRDSDHYDDASDRLKESYDYAQSRYKQLQKKMFTKSSENYFTVLKTFPKYAARAFQDAANKYKRSFNSDGVFFTSEWRGPVVLGFMGIVLVYILIASFVSVLSIKVLKRFVKGMQTPEFLKHEPCLILLCGFLLFAISVSIAKSFVENNFFAVASELLLIYSWLVVAILLSLIIRLDGDSIRAGMRLYLPITVIGIIVITLRILFVPNRMLTLVFPPLLAGTFFWQLAACKKNKDSVKEMDQVVGYLSLFIFALATVLSWFGYVLLSLQIVIWALFQITAVESVTALNVLIGQFWDKTIAKRFGVEDKRNKRDVLAKVHKGEYIRMSWFPDMLRIAVIPALSVLSVPICVYLALDVFDMTELCETIFNYTLFDLTDSNGAEILQINIKNIVKIASLFFVFKYLNYLLRSVYRDLKLRAFKRTNDTQHVRTNQINLTLANNVIGILVWGTYIIVSIILLKIPMGALSIVAAGLATGLGLAMKDILNNFIYGIQLMSGRLRVGDWIECDGIRGKVTEISYQSTQIETEDGAVMSFLNTALFNKNFKNLTRNNSYEVLKVIVGVGYGTDVEHARSVLLEALEQTQYKDRYNRDVIDMKRGINVLFEEFGDSSVNLAVKMFVLVPEKAGFRGKVKEAIYDALTSHGIEIPFPQRDVHIIG